MDQALGPTCFLLPLEGANEWDRVGADLHDGPGMAAFCKAMQHHCPKSVHLKVLNAHINDAAFAQAALDVFDQWVADGIVPRSAIS